MKKTVYSYFVLVAILSLNSCQNHEVLSHTDSKENKIELTKHELLSITFNEDSELEEKEAIDILTKYLNNGIKTRQNQGGINIENIEKKYIEDEIQSEPESRGVKATTFLYEIDVNSDGEDYTAIVSGDKRFPFVLAYFTKCNLKNEESHRKVLPLYYSENILMNNIKAIELLQDSLREPTLEKIAKELEIAPKEINIDNIKNSITVKEEINSRALIVTNPPSDAIAGSGPFVKVSWDCGMPYNKLMDQNCSDNWLWDYRYPISSVVVATAQILSYFQPAMVAQGTTIDWSYLCKKEEIHDTSDYFGSYTKDPDDKCLMIAKLMKYIGEQCEVTYSCNSSSVYFSKVIDFLKSYGIYMDGEQGMNVTTLKASIDELQPVFMYGQTSSGGGHWWIVDGYRTQVATRGTFFPGFNVYMHANMGQGKSYTGYYLVSTDGSLTFDASFAHFNTNLKMYPNVRTNN